MEAAVGTGVLAWIKPHLNYLFQYHDNIDKLSSKVKILEDRIEEVQDEVCKAINNSQIIKDRVTNWLERVKVIKAEAEAILRDEDKVGNGCWKGWCLNLRSRYLLSMKAAEEASKLAVLLDEGQFMTVAKPQLPLAFVSATSAQHVPEGIALSFAGTHGGLESRLSILEHVMEAVKDDQIRIVRICGMGGIGKTTMANEVKKMARERHLFDDIPMVEFNQDPDFKIIQHYMAEQLGLELKEENVKARKDRLLNRLKGKTQNGEGQNEGGKNKRILVILDNVWRREDLEEIGIPLGDDLCKILLTSRQHDVCKNIALEKEFNIESLSDPEARILFHQSLDRAPCYDQLVEEILKACGGLPLAIKTIARLLANKSENAWGVVVTRLKNSETSKGVYGAIFNTLKVSYDYLEIEEIKKLFRLCCLFRKGFDVPIEDLARYGFALRLFTGDNLYQARAEAHFYVETLLQSNLLLDSNYKDSLRVKLHDVVWEFAVSLESDGKFMVKDGDGSKEWPKSDSYADCTAISMQCNENQKFPEGLNCKKLELLQLIGRRSNTFKFPEKFYEGIGQLYVLALLNMNVPLTPKSLELLTNLRTLSLDKCSLGDGVSMIGNLGQLEVLSFAYSDIKELPSEIGKLTGLRLLDLNECAKLHAIAPGVFPRLISLEELYMRGTPLCRGDKVQATFNDITSLSKLVVIDIQIPLEVLLPMYSLFKKLKKFKISINKFERSEAGYLFQNSLDLKCDSSFLLQDGMKLLVQETERMYLRVTGLKTLLDNSGTWDFSNLKSLSLVSCNELVYLINSVRKIKFRCLKSLSLQDLPNLVGFCKAGGAVEFPQLVELELNNLPLFTSLHPETETSASGHSHASSSLLSLNQKGSHKICGFQNLSSLKVMSCGSLRHLSTPSTAIYFGELQHLEVESCESLQAIVAAEGREGGESAMEEILLPKLNHLLLTSLPNLTAIVPKGYTLGWSSLEKLEVYNCGGESDIFANTNSIQEGSTGRQTALTSLEEMEIKKTNSTDLLRNHFPGGFSYELRKMTMSDRDIIVLPHSIRELHHLEVLSLESCESLKVVFDLEQLKAGGEEHKIAMLNKLSRIKIDDLSRMTHVWNKVPKNFEGFHNLTDLTVRSCDSLRYLLSPPIAKCLLKLRRVSIWHCKGIEEVVSIRDGEGDQGQQLIDMVLFPQLQELHLENLPRLMSFGPAEACAFNKLSLEAPNVGSTEAHHGNANTSISTLISNEKVASNMLEDMKVSGTNSGELWCDHFPVGFSYGGRRIKLMFCNKLLVLFSSHALQGFHHLEWLEVERCESLEVVFDLEEELTVAGTRKLEELRNIHLDTLWRMTHVWKKVPKDFEGFHNLRKLEVEYCGSLRYLFSPSIAKCLVNLGELSIKYCRGMEEVVSMEDEEDQRNAVHMTFFFPKLHDITLIDLPSLVCFAPAGAYAFDKLSLEAPDDVGSSETEHVGNSTTSTSFSIFSEKSANHLGYVFPPNMVVRLPVLQSLVIERCHSLRYIFSSSMVRSLVQLKNLRIIDCEMMEVILKDEDEGNEAKAEAEADSTSKLVFPHLISIKLGSLPNLKGFCLGVHGFEWPSLTSVEINYCLNMGIFTSGYSNTPILGDVLINSNRHSMVGGLNTTLTSVREKDLDNLAFKEEGILTINGFLLAGEHLVVQCPSWSWESGMWSEPNTDLPDRRKFLIARNVPCLGRAGAGASSSTVAVEGKNEDDNEYADENIPRPRTYDVSITYDEDNRTACMWLKGYDESKTILPLELVLEDIAQDHPRELVTIEYHPHLCYVPYVSLYQGDCIPIFIKNFSGQKTSQGFEPAVHNYLQLLLDYLVPVIPTIQYMHSNEELR